jgi:hypothetical protein
MSERNTGNALPSICYGDPAEFLDELRLMRAKAERKAKLDRKHKSMRIQASVRNVMKNGGDKRGRK